MGAHNVSQPYIATSLYVVTAVCTYVPCNIAPAELMMASVLSSCFTHTHAHVLAKSLLCHSKDYNNICKYCSW